MDADDPLRSRPGRCRLILTIKGRHYAVRPIASQADDVTRARPAHIKSLEIKGFLHE
jgi:hypothetical protein